MDDETDFETSEGDVYLVDGTVDLWVDGTLTAAWVLYAEVTGVDAYYDDGGDFHHDVTVQYIDPLGDLITTDTVTFSDVRDAVGVWLHPTDRDPEALLAERCASNPVADVV